MIVTERMTVGERGFIRTYSDSGYLIKKDGTDEIYSEAIDPVEFVRTYTETDRPEEEV